MYKVTCIKSHPLAPTRVIRILTRADQKVVGLMQHVEWQTTPATLPALLHFSSRYGVTTHMKGGMTKKGMNAEISRFVYARKLRTAFKISLIVLTSRLNSLR